MKKLYTLACAAITAATALANPVATRDRNSLPSLEDFFKSIPEAEHVGATRAGEVIEVAPSKTEIKNANVSYFAGGELVLDDNRPLEVCFDGDDVYIQNPVSRMSYKSFIKGTKNGDEVEFSLPQSIIFSESYGYGINVGLMEFNGGTYVPVADEDNKVVYTINSDGTLSLELGNSIDDTNPQYILGVYYSIDPSWLGYGEIYQEIGDPIYEERQLPEDLNWQSWAMYEGYYQTFVKVAIDNNDVYIMGLFPGMPEGWIKGEIKGDNIEFPSGQYLGVDPYYCLYGFYQVTNTDKEPLETGLAAYYPDKQTIIADEDQIWYECATPEFAQAMGIDYLNNAYFFYQTEEQTNANPMNPVLYNFAQFQPEVGMGMMIWLVYSINVDNFVLPNDKVYYNYYMNGEKMVFDPAFLGTSEAMSDIPWDFSASNNMLMSMSFQKLCYILQPAETIGCQVFYEGSDGTTYSSELVTETVASRVAQNLADKQVKSVSYTDLSGMRISNPERGLYIKTTEYTDGTKFVEKLLVK